MATNVTEIVKAINQIAHYAQDHQYGGNEPPLDREEGHKINDPRVNEGFKVAIGRNILGVLYHARTDLSQTYESNYDQNMKKKLEDIISFIKKEYKDMMDETLKLKKVGEPKVLVQKRSNKRAYVQVKCYYEIKNIDMEDEDEEKAKEKKDIFDDIDPMLNENDQKKNENSFEKQGKQYRKKLFSELVKKTVGE